MEEITLNLIKPNLLKRGETYRIKNKQNNLFFTIMATYIKCEKCFDNNCYYHFMIKTEIFYSIIKIRKDKLDKFKYLIFEVIEQ